ncbi:MAG: polysaccharide deacetylase family protein [Muribaculaceae bacterium]|nr:polysaccharide deacetylase family protein [Muribaculaceae bacterium]
MLVERPPLLYRMLFPETVWRIHKRRRTVYITFDDGPIPEVTPWVLDTLDRYGVKATFFCVGENVERHPELFEEIKRRGHSVGNHTMNHLQGRFVTTRNYLLNVFHAHDLIGSTLFRPPHGLLRWGQSKVLRERFSIIMYDLVTRDYSNKLNGEQVLDNVKTYARNGSIIVFHDSLKAEQNMKYALPRAIEWLQAQGYTLERIEQL